MKIAKQKYKHIKVYHEPKFWQVLRTPMNSQGSMAAQMLRKMYLNSTYGKLGK